MERHVQRSSVWMRLASLLLPLLLGAPLSAQRPPAARQTSSPVGTWRGTSLCLVRPSPCHDENVVYRVTRLTARDSLSLDARKVVNGQEEEMGVLTCRLGTPATQVTCTMRNGVWHFTVSADSLVGELRLSDNTKFRDIRTARAPR